jgi:thiamine pyrophosphate-dependent acetolactate synthase large subunit-like protein
LFGGAELATAVQHGINLVTILFNNSAYGNVLRDQRRMFDGRGSGSELRNPDFQMFAKSFGVQSWKVTDAAGLKVALKDVTWALRQAFPSAVLKAVQKVGMTAAPLVGYWDEH